MVLKFIFSQNKDLQNMYDYIQNISLQTHVKLSLFIFIFLTGMSGFNRFPSTKSHHIPKIVVTKKNSEKSNGKKAKTKR